MKYYFMNSYVLVNNLQTTAAPRHPLLGLMDIPAYTPPPNSTVETYVGHSKVAKLASSQVQRINKKQVIH